MASREDIGNVTQIEVYKKYFKWTVANFSSFLQGDIQIVSPKFYFQYHHCALGLQIFDDEDWIGIHLLISPKSFLIRVKLGILDSDKIEYRNFNIQDNHDYPTHHLYEEQHFLSKSELNRVLHSGKLTIFCEIQQEDLEREVADTIDDILAA